jgi:hypothetical protein
MQLHAGGSDVEEGIFRSLCQSKVDGFQSNDVVQRLRATQVFFAFVATWNHVHIDLKARDSSSIETTADWCADVQRRAVRAASPEELVKLGLRCTSSVTRTECECVCVRLKPQSAMHTHLTIVDAAAVYVPLDAGRVLEAVLVRLRCIARALARSLLYMENDTSGSCIPLQVEAARYVLFEDPVAKVRDDVFEAVLRWCRDIHQLGAEEARLSIPQDIIEYMARAHASVVVANVINLKRRPDRYVSCS